MSEQTTVQEQPQEQVLPLNDAVENTANTFWKLQELRGRLVQRQREMIEAIKADPELSALQESIDLLSNSVKVMESDYELSRKQVRESALAEWTPDTPKTLYNGLLTVRELSNSVLHWDDGKALEYALTVDEQFRSALLKADKSGFKKLASFLDMPTEAIEIGSKWTVAIADDELVNYVTVKATDEGVADAYPKNDLKRGKSDDNGASYTVNPDDMDVPF